MPMWRYFTSDSEDDDRRLALRHFVWCDAEIPFEHRLEISAWLKINSNHFHSSLGVIIGATEIELPSALLATLFKLRWSE